MGYLIALGLFSIIPLMIAFPFIAMQLGGIGIAVFPFALLYLFIYLIILIACYLAYQWLPCPRCHQRFLFSWVTGGNPFDLKVFLGRKCCHCGLEKNRTKKRA
jgi:hypothetical protein